MRSEEDVLDVEGPSSDADEVERVVSFALSKTVLWKGSIIYMHTCGKAQFGICWRSCGIRWSCTVWRDVGVTYEAEIMRVEQSKM